MKLKAAVSAEDHIQGPEDAAVTLVEYGDYQCPFCGAAHPVVKRLQKHFGESLRFVFRNFPLTEIHAMAETAAETAEYAATQGKFWEMHDGIYEHQSRLSVELLTSLAEKHGLDARSLGEALENSTFEERVKKDFMSGVRSGVNGTPSFFINGARHDGPADFDSLASGIEAARQG